MHDFMPRSRELTQKARLQPLGLSHYPITLLYLLIINVLLDENRELGKKCGEQTKAHLK